MLLTSTSNMAVAICYVTPVAAVESVSVTHRVASLADELEGAYAAKVNRVYRYRVRTCLKAVGARFCTL